jgi:hypothetical protein
MDDLIGILQCAQQGQYGGVVLSGVCARAYCYSLTAEYA